MAADQSNASSQTASVNSSLYSANEPRNKPAEDESSREHETKQGKQGDIPMTEASIYFFRMWTVSCYVAFALNLANVEWVYVKQHLNFINIAELVLLLLSQQYLLSTALELPVMGVATVLVRRTIKEVTYGGGKYLSVIINYNLLASDEEEIDVALENQYSTYMDNISPHVVAVLVSATGDQRLKDYEIEKRDQLKEKIKEVIMEEGKAMVEGEPKDAEFAKRAFGHYDDIFKNNKTYFLKSVVPYLAGMYSENFMVIHRVTRVLKKCGQYQDLMLLSEEGTNKAWTYTDPEYYTTMARKAGEDLFYPSEDVEKLKGKKYLYTLVLDADTRMDKGDLGRLMDVAAANPERAIIQPAILITAYEDQTIFMHIEKIRQQIYHSMTTALSHMHGRCGFYGKGLIKNSAYIEKMLGTPENPIERVPIEVLSHDTYEAAVLAPLFVNDVFLLEEPCGNYVTWDIREARWNRGELVLSHHFYPYTARIPFEYAMKILRPLNPPPKLKLRTVTHFNKTAGHVAHAALKQMVLKPVLLTYCISSIWIPIYLKYPYLPLSIIMFCIAVLPKVAVRNSPPSYILIEIISSGLQYSPEPIMGTLRVFKAIKAHVTGKSNWVPQFQIERDFLQKPAFVVSLIYQWKICLVSILSGFYIIYFKPESMIVMALFGSTAVLPLYTTITSIPLNVMKRYIHRLSCRGRPRSKDNNDIDEEKGEPAHAEDKKESKDTASGYETQLPKLEEHVKESVDVLNIDKKPPDADRLDDNKSSRFEAESHSSVIMDEIARATKQNAVVINTRITEKENIELGAAPPDDTTFSGLTESSIDVDKELYSSLEVEEQFSSSSTEKYLSATAQELSPDLLAIDNGMSTMTEIETSIYSHETFKNSLHYLHDDPKDFFVGTSKETEEEKFISMNVFSNGEGKGIEQGGKKKTAIVLNVVRKPKREGVRKNFIEGAKNAYT